MLPEVLRTHGYRLWSDDMDPDGEQAWKAEIKRRLAKIEEGDFSASDWRDAVKRILESLGEQRSGPPGHFPHRNGDGK
jgi:Putative addiction module component